MTTALILQETQNLTDGLTRTAVIISDGDGRCGEAWVMHITERFMRQVTEQDYTLSVVDTDGDELLESARLRATDLRSAWEQAIVIAFRACHGSGAFPTTISVRRRSAISVQDGLRHK